MDESRLRSTREDVEAHVEIPDFAVVARRGDRIRRRRAIGATAAVAVAVAVVVIGFVRTFDSDRALEPVHEPRPVLDTRGAKAVLADPDAQVDPDASKVDGAGDMLAVVALPGGAGPCGAADGTAFRWSGAAGRTVSWREHPRPVVALPDGFVVGAVADGCRSGSASDETAYLVDRDGVAHGITWGEGAEQVCAEQPADPRCRFDVEQERGSLLDAVRLPPGTEPIDTGPADVFWARSPDGRRLHWSTDGTTWQSRTTSLPRGSIVSASAAGSWGVLAGDTTVEYTSDAGATWHTRDVSQSLRTVRTAEVDWTVTRSGVLLGTTQLVGRGRRAVPQHRRVLDTVRRDRRPHVVRPGPPRGARGCGLRRGRRPVGRLHR